MEKTRVEIWQDGSKRMFDCDSLRAAYDVVHELYKVDEYTFAKSKDTVWRDCRLFGFSNMFFSRRVMVRVAYVHWTPILPKSKKRKG